MNCQRVEQLLSDGLEGRLSEAAGATVAAHMTQCPACRQFRDEYATLGADLRALLDLTPPDGAEQQAVHRWLSEEAVRQRSSIGPSARGRFHLASPSHPGFKASLAAATVLLAATGFFLIRRSRQSPNPAASLQIASRPLAAAHSGRSGPIKPDPPIVTTPTVQRTPGGGEDLNGVRTSVRFGRHGTAISAGLSNRPRLSIGRPRLHSVHLAAGDLAYLNGDPTRAPSRWVPLSPRQWEAVEVRVRRNVRVQDDFVQIPFPRLAAASDRQVVTATEGYKREAAIVDARLVREVTLQLTATALSDLCDRLRADTGIQLAAGNSVADEKVTLLCEKLPLREVMRQLSRPFGYTWLRSGKPGEYKYELAQDLKSQLLEEELRNRDRRDALLALEADIDRYRPYLRLSPDEALAQSKTAGPGDKALLEQLAGRAWGPLHMYPRLSSQELAALRAGEELTFSEAPRPGEQPRPAHLQGGALPSEVARGALQSLRFRRLIETDEGWEYTPETDRPGVRPPAAIPEARAVVRLKLTQSDLGQFTISGSTGVFTIGKSGGVHWYGSNGGSIGSGLSPAARKPGNAAANASLAHDPALQRRISLDGSRLSTTASPFPIPSAARPGTGDSQPPAPERRATTADVLEALHRATGMPIVADFYTRLYKPETVTVRNQPLFSALNDLSDAMRLRWRKEDGWLQFRSTTYYDDRLKEVPNRLLNRWADARRRQGSLNLDNLCEISQLSDAQLDAAEMAEGARGLWGLAEWELVGVRNARRYLRYVASLTSAQRQEAMSTTGLPFTHLTLGQQQQFLALGVGGGPLQSLDDLQGSVLRVDYTQPGWFQWGEPGFSGYYTRWVVPLEPGPQGRRAPRPPVRERTREATLQAMRRVDRSLREALLQAVRRSDPGVGSELEAFEAAQIFPTRLDLVFIFIPGASNARPIYVMDTASGTDGQSNYRLR